MADGSTITGQVAVATISSSCALSSASFSGKIALILSSSSCSSLSAAYYVERSGGLAMLFAYNLAATPPPVALEVNAEQMAQFPVTIPTLALTLDDANLIKNAAASSTITLSADKSRAVGGDAEVGKPLADLPPDFDAQLKALGREMVAREARYRRSQHVEHRARTWFCPPGR